MKKTEQVVFVCRNCGNESSKWMGKCLACGEWNSLVEAPAERKNQKSSRSNVQSRKMEPVMLKSLDVEAVSRVSTGISELDMVIGGGVVAGQVVLVAGEPGIGKSTLLLQVAMGRSEGRKTREVRESENQRGQRIRESERSENQRIGGVESGVLYVCGEESTGQVAMRAKRLGLDVSGCGVELLEQTDVDQITKYVSETKRSDAEVGQSDIDRRIGGIRESERSENQKIGVSDRSESQRIGAVGGSEISEVSEDWKSGRQMIIVDSIQTLTTGDLPGMAGSVTQVKECALRLITLAKERDISMFIVGHVTKEGDIAGPRVLEHMVDTVVWFEGDRSQQIRTVRTIKNRFGPTDEVGIFRMTDRGLVEVSNPSEYLLEERVKGVPGSVVSVVMEGTRPMLVEVQALTVSSQLPVPRRVATGVDFNRLQIMVAVLTRRAGIDLAGFDIFVNIAGGVKISDPGLDLAVCLAIASSIKDRAVDSTIAAVGEVGLMGEVRKASNLEKRVKEAKKLGYRVASAESGKEVAAAIKKLV